MHNGENATISGVCLERLPQISQAIHFKVNLNKIQFKHLKEQRKGFQNNYLRYRYRLYDCDKIFALLSRKDIWTINRTFYLWIKIYKHRLYKRDSWRTTSCIYRNTETLLWFSAITENISIATIQPIQNGISSKPRHLPSEH